MLPLVKMV